MKLKKERNMSDCCSPPGVGPLPERLSKPDYDTYNPSEVRLYGRPAVPQPIVSEEGFRRIDEGLSRVDIRGEDKNAIRSILKELVELQVAEIYHQKIILAVVDPQIGIVRLPVEINIPSRNYRGDDSGYIKSIGVIYGYAYEGHCYKLPKPQIMYLPEEPRAILDGECGCDCGYVPELGYAVWQVDKLERVIALDVRSDDVKTLILDENTPGNRSPMAYAQTMALAPQRHRD
jgi:hypothetical protein